MHMYLALVSLSVCHVARLMTTVLSGCCETNDDAAAVIDLADISIIIIIIVVVVVVMVIELQTLQPICHQYSSNISSVARNSQHTYFTNLFYSCHRQLQSTSTIPLHFYQGQLSLPTLRGR